MAPHNSGVTRQPLWLYKKMKIILHSITACFCNICNFSAALILHASTALAYTIWQNWLRPVESHSGAWGNILAGPVNICTGPSGKYFFEFFFLKWYILAYFIFVTDGGAPKRCGARGGLPLYPTLSTGLNWPVKCCLSSQDKSFMQKPLNAAILVGFFLLYQTNCWIAHWLITVNKVACADFNVSMIAVIHKKETSVDWPIHLISK